MALAWGPIAQYEPNFQQRITCCELPGGKFVVAYQIGADGTGWVVVGSVAGDVITFGAPVQYTVGQLYVESHSLTPIDTDKFVIAYGDTGLGSDGYIRVGVVTGEAIALGAAVEFQNNNVSRTALCQLGTDKFGLIYKDQDNADAYVMIGNVIGNVINALGGGVIFDANGSNHLDCVRWDDDKFIVAYVPLIGLLPLQLFVVTVVGLVPTCHAQTNFEVIAGTVIWNNAIAKIDTNLLAITWRRGAGGVDPNNAHCVRLGEVSGNAIIAGPYYVLNPFPEYGNYRGAHALTTNPAQFIVMYKNDEAGAFLGYGTYNVLDYLGTTITNFGAKQWWNTIVPFGGALSSANLFNGKLVAVWQDAAGDGKARIGVFLNPPAVTTNPATGVT